ncbi:hypothetical protein FDE89_19010 (plasmid) [Acinetobacter baumannii]|nr:OsmC family protein [Acinetobacter baumannii]QCP22191.1 hypothetical protein FDE89_19010 [Acinetobacter baumannii]
MRKVVYRAKAKATGGRDGRATKLLLNVYLIGMDREEAEKLVAAAHIVCPYSNATRNNIDVTFNIVTE